MRRLESVASTRQLITTDAARIRRLSIDIALCFVLPCIHLVLSYVSQGHRYDIVEHIGCQIPAFMAWPHIVIQFVIPLTLATCAIIYACESSSSSSYSMCKDSVLSPSLVLRSIGFPLVHPEASSIQSCS